MTETPRQLTLRDLSLAWFGLLGAAIAWMAQFLGGYGYEEAACSNETGTGVVEPLVLGLTVGFGAVAVVSGLAALATWRGVERGVLADPRGRVRFMAGAGLLAAVLFFLLIAAKGFLLLFLDACVPG